ncbi:Aste57867_19641 [Aphanomyces stellatus]|uniref:Aste57867_19641 protein n=1 Tax=Aphanomyces stellatus TaxID=120398 RepID=A0A485LD31_9STRA|nr:hypothetical protein As57867_019576 [Aphanomyces stellatus]VFT96341.1 Aste57867_19641 [Aphanomyces stellatus]
MDFLRSIEDDLNLVEVETKKKLPAVKDAAEKGIEKIGQIRQLYAQMLRVEREAPGPGNTIFKSDAILQPFLLACNHATASQKLLIASFNSIQKLVSWDAITTEAVGNILRVLQIQAERNGAQDIQLKLLQTLLQLLTLAFNKGDEQMTNDDLISQAIWICLHLQSQSGNAITANTAIMTLRQIVTMVFDNVTAQPPAADDDGGSDRRDLAGAKKVGFLVFQDLCLMSREEAGVWLKRTTFSKVLGIELIEAVLTSHGALFRADVEFRSMLKQHAKHLIVSNLAASSPFPLLLRVMRLAATVLCQFSALLEDECNTIWLCLVEIISTGTFSTNSTGTKSPMFLHMQRSHHPSRSFTNHSSSSPALTSASSSASALTVNNPHAPAVNYVTWHVLLAMEVIFKACGEQDVLPALSTYPNHLLLILARTISAVVTTSPPSDYKPPAQSDHASPYRCALEYLNEQEAPPLQPFYHCLRISLHCQNLLVTSLHAAAAAPALSPLRQQYILCSLAPFVMNAFHCTMRFCREAELVTMALKGYHMLTNVNAHTRARVPVECRPIGVLSIQALCVFSFPIPDASRVVRCITGAGVLTSMEFPDDFFSLADTSMSTSSAAAAAEPCLLTWKEMHAMKTLFRTIHTMEQELNEVEWRTLLEGFEIIVSLSQLKQKTKGVGQRIGTGPSAVKVEDEDVEQQLVMLGQSILEYFQNTASLHGAALRQILRALRTICYEQINLSVPPTPPTSPAPDEAPIVEDELQLLLALWSPDQQTAWDVLSLSFGQHLKTYDATLGIIASTAATTFVPSFSLRMFVQLGKTNVDAWGFVLDELVGFACLAPPSTSSSSTQASMTAFQTFATDAVFQLVQAALTTFTTLSQPTVAGYVLQVLQSDTMKERGLVGLLDLLQTSGHLVHDAWPVLLQGLVAAAEYDARCQVVAFKSVRLIVDDLVASMGSSHRQACIACVGAYATHAKDVNISLTAINELWSLADNIAKQNLTDDVAALWPVAFAELERLALDKRPEVRNCAINTLFGTAVTHGAQFRLVEWTIFLQETVLPLAHALSAVVESPPETQDPTVVLHHSRDSVAKQYDESRVLVLSGISRVLQTNTASLLLHADWFVRVWQELMRTIAQSCTRDIAKEVVLAAVQTLHTLLQIASTASQDPSAAPLRAGVGMRIVNGVCTTTTAAPAAGPSKKPTLLSRDPQLWTEAFDLLLRLANDRGVGTVDAAQEQDIASAMVTVFVSIYLQSKETELHDMTKVRQILDVFGTCMDRYVLAPASTAIVVTTNSLHARILNSYDECGYFDESVHVLEVRQVVGFVRAASSRAMVFVVRHAIQSLAKVYEHVSTAAQAETFVEVLDVVAPCFRTKNDPLPDSATAADKASAQMWKHALKVLLVLISHGLHAIPVAAHRSTFAALFAVIESVLVPHSGATTDDADAAALELSLLDCLVQNMMAVRYHDAALTTTFVSLLRSDLSSHTPVAAACIQHMTALAAPHNPNTALREVCRQQLTSIFVEAIAAFLESSSSSSSAATTTNALTNTRSRVVLLLTSMATAASATSILEVFASLCQLITCDDVEIRELVQRVLLQSNVAGVCLPLLRAAAPPP